MNEFINREEAEKYVTNGLARRKIERETAEKEAALDQYEVDQLNHVHENCVDAKERREDENKVRQFHEQKAARRAALEAERARVQDLEYKSVKAVRYYGLVCIATFWIAAVTRFPFWAAITLIAVLAVFPMAYIFRLYYPIQTSDMKGEKKYVQH